MRRLPLYPVPALTPLERERPISTDPFCLRCKLGHTAKTVCAPPRGAPGGILLLADQLTSEEAKLGRSGVGRLHMTLISKLHRLSGKAPIFFDTAVKCHAGAEVPDKAIDACRGYLAQVLHDVKPTRIIAVGSAAVQSVLGRSPHLPSVRKGYGWLWDAPWMPAVTLDDGRVVHPLPVYLVSAAGPAQRNRFLAKWLEEDLAWAATTPPPELPPWGGFTEVITDLDDAVEAAMEIQAAEDPRIAFDVETSGRMHAGELQIVSCAIALVGTDRSWVWDAEALKHPDVKQVLCDILIDPSIYKEGQSVKFDLQAIYRGLGVRVAGLSGDTRIFRKLQDSDAVADLETMQEIVGMGGGKEDMDAAVKTLAAAETAKAQALKAQLMATTPGIQSLLTGQKDQLHLLLAKYGGIFDDATLTTLWRGLRPKAYVYADVDRDLLTRYNALDSVSTGRLAKRQRADLEAKDTIFGWNELFGPGTEAMAQVESWGFPVDKAQLHSLSQYFGAQMQQIEVSTFAQYPGFSPGSPASVADLLFKKLGLSATKVSKKTGAPSTDHESLEALAGQHPVVDGLLDYRRFAKLKSQYADGLILHVARDGRIHTTYNVDGARSGRMSSENPNMQNIPSDAKPDGKLVKKCFIARPGYVLLASDYKQLEFRVAADLANDSAMKHVFLSGQDFHTATAEMIAPIVWKIQPHQITKVHRGGAKCFHPDTEVLTRTGWRRIPDVLPGEEVMTCAPRDGFGVDMAWDVPTDVFTADHPDQELIHLRNEGMDIRVTPDHGMLAFTKAGVPRQRVLPDEFVSTAQYWANAGVLRGAGRTPDQWLLRLAVATQADGSLARGAIRYGFSKVRKVDRLRHLLSAACVGFSETGPTPAGVTRFRVPVKAAGRVLALLDGKSMPWSWLELSEEARGWVLDEARYWDGHERSTWRAYGYYSSDEQSVDVLQALAALTGRKTRKVDPRPCGTYRLTVRDRHTTRGGGLSATRSEYTGKVACLTVPSGCVLVRDGGVPLIVNQTFNFGIMYGMSDGAIAHRAGCDMATARAIRAAVTGKFRRFAAWIQESLAYTRSTGQAWTYWLKRRAYARSLYLIGDEDDGKRINAENSSYNTPVQGSASFYCLASVTALVKWILRTKIDAKVVATVHDSIVIEVREDLLHEVAQMMHKIMTGWPTMTGVPLDIDMECGPTWGTMEVLPALTPAGQAAAILGGPEAGAMVDHAIMYEGAQVPELQ